MTRTYRVGGLACASSPCPWPRVLADWQLCRWLCFPVSDLAQQLENILPVSPATPGLCPRRVLTAGPPAPRPAGPAPRLLASNPGSHLCSACSTSPRCRLPWAEVQGLPGEARASPTLRGWPSGNFRSGAALLLPTPPNFCQPHRKHLRDLRAVPSGASHCSELFQRPLSHGGKTDRSREAENDLPCALHGPPRVSPWAAGPAWARSCQGDPGSPSPCSPCGSRGSSSSFPKPANIQWKPRLPERGAVLE